MRLPPGPGTNILTAVTAVLSLVAMIAFGAQMAVFGAGFVPLRLTGVDPLATEIVVPALLTPLTYCLVDGDWIGLLLNCLLLMFLGRFVEQALGWRLMVSLYIAAALVGALTFYVIDPLAPLPLFGARVPVSGIIGAYAVLYGNNAERALGPLSPRTVRALSLLLGWLVLVAALEFAGSGTVTPHAVLPSVAAFAVGLGLARPLLGWRYRRA